MDSPIQNRIASFDSKVTASEIARHTGRSRFAARRAAGCPPTTQADIAGNCVDAWCVADLPPKLREEIDPYDISALEKIVEGWGKSPPTDIQRADLLECAFVKLDELLASGLSAVQKARQISWMTEHVPQLGGSQAAIRRMYDRYFARWRASGGKRSSLFDKRHQVKLDDKRRAAPIPEADIEKLAIYAVHGKGLSVREAWIACWERLSPQTRSRYPLGREVPLRVRTAVMARAIIMKPWHIGRRAARLNGAYITRDYSNVFAGDVLMMDDHTLDAKCYIADNPAVLLRPQLLVQIDFRSLFITNWALELSPGWTAVTAAGLIRRAAREIGLPRKGYYWERGKFKDAKILGKGGFTNILMDERETFADRLGLEIKHALPGNARAKTVERVLGEIAKRAARLPGYVGPDEMHVQYERVREAAKRVESGLTHPRDAGFLSADELAEAMRLIVEHYNATVMDSPVVTGLVASPADAWERLQPTDDAGRVVGLSKLPRELEYLVYGYVDIVNVSRAGISLFGGKYRYCGEETGRIQGFTVKVYFDPESPESVAITDLDGENVRTVKRLIEPDAWSGEGLKEASAAVQAHNAAQRRIYSAWSQKYYAPPARPFVVTPGAIPSILRGLEIERGKAEVNMAQVARTRPKAQPSPNKAYLDRLLSGKSL